MLDSEIGCIILPGNESPGSFCLLFFFFTKFIVGTLQSTSLESLYLYLTRSLPYQPLLECENSHSNAGTIVLYKIQNNLLREKLRVIWEGRLRRVQYKYQRDSLKPYSEQLQKFHQEATVPLQFQGKCQSTPLVTYVICLWPPMWPL